MKKNLAVFVIIWLLVAFTNEVFASEDHSISATDNSSLSSGISLSLNENLLPPKENIPKKIEVVPYAEEVFRVKGMYRLVDDCSNYPVEKMDVRIQNFNSVLDGMDPHIPTYVYFVENSRSHPLELTFPEESDAYIHLKENLHADVFDHLKYTTFEQFCQYFYTTDHHWNYLGAYQGYVDIVRMLKGEEEELLVPKELVTLPALYDGAYSRKNQKAFSKEYFALYRYNRYPEYTSYVNNKKKAYDHIKNYLSGRINKEPLVNHYATCYGGDNGLILFKNNHPSGKGTLLILGDSMSNAVKTLLIEHYDTIVYVDLRHYSGTRGVGKPFSMRDITSKYHIDQILFLSNMTMYTKYDSVVMNP
ncbi:MAG: hypothetical protein K5663_01985 [Clostridiales bacterium]|nr:hypothetical protein [Clostridiales bacterium]